MHRDLNDHLQSPSDEAPTFELLHRLERMIGKQDKLQGPGVRRSQLPWGTIHRFRGTGGSGGVSPIFRPTVNREGDTYRVTWNTGLIGGMEPTINGVPLSGADPDTKQPPVFTFDASQFGERGSLNIYFRLSIDHDWRLSKVEPFALATAPPLAPWQYDKLVVIVYADGTKPWRALYSNMGWIAINRRSNGLAQHEFWSK